MPRRDEEYAELDGTIARLTRERDEARAEVERYRVSLETISSCDCVEASLGGKCNGKCNSCIASAALEVRVGIPDGHGNMFCEKHRSHYGIGDVCGWCQKAAIC